MSTEVIEYGGIPKRDIAHIYVTQKGNAASVYVDVTEYTHWKNIPYIKYDIKETDFRRKTATFTTPNDFDLTNGLYLVRIISKYHENFVGVILSKDWSKEKDNAYTYQCQDFSRFYQSKPEVIINSLSPYDIVGHLLTHGDIKWDKSITYEDKKKYKGVLSGLRPLALYNPKLFHNPISVNMMAQKLSFVARDKSYMDIIEAIVHSNAYVDTYFNSNGVLQIEPINLEEWRNTGLVLTDVEEKGSANFKFDTTNVITGVNVQGEGLNIGKSIRSSDLFKNIGLTAFFGVNWSTLKSNSTNENVTISGSSSSSNNNNQNSNPDNPYGTKKKYLFIDADGGETASFLRAIRDEIYKLSDGWTISIDLNISSKAHSRNYKKVKNGCYMPVYNGLCADTIHEMALSYYGGVIKKNGSVLCPAWDSRTFKNRGMKQYENDLTGIKNLRTAWDWNRRKTIGNLKNPAQYMTKNGIKYCIGTSARSIAEQFLAGGWCAYNNRC